MKNGKIRLTLLNAMAGGDIFRSMDQHAAWNLRVMDLKDSIFGKSIEALCEKEAEALRQGLEQRGLGVHCLSTALFHRPLEEGEAAFRRSVWPLLENVLACGKILGAAHVRLLAAKLERSAGQESTAVLRSRFPWIFRMYEEAVDRIRSAGMQALIENEVRGCIFHTPAEVLSFFQELKNSGSLGFIWDIQNMWECGTYPSLEAYETLRPLIRAVHLKGGQEGEDRCLRFASSLQAATWPVLEITGKILSDGVSPVLCLNPSHGERRPGFDTFETAAMDIAFLRHHFTEVE